MRRLWLLLTITLLCVGAGMAMVWQRSHVSTVPMIPLVPAMPIASAPAASGASRSEVDPADAGTIGLAERVAPPVAAPDDRVAVLVVEVLRPSGPATPAVESAASTQDGGTRLATEPIADVEVEVAVDGEPADEPFHKLTDARGLARFEVPGGDGKAVTVRCPVGAAAQVRLQGATAVHLTLQFRWRGTVRGSVVDAAGRGVPGADLVLLPAGEQELAAPRLHQLGRCRADGSFELALALGGAVGAQHPGYAPSAMWSVPVQSDPTRPPITTVLQLNLLSAQSGLQGRVVDSSGLPVAGADLAFRSLATPPTGATLAAPPRRARSADDGNFVVHDLRPGRIEFAARASGHGFQHGTLEVAAGAVKLLEIRLQPGCEVHGRVENGAGEPVANVRVWCGAIDDLECAWTVTGADGTFQLAGLPPGAIGLTAREGTGRSAEPMAQRAQTHLELLPGRVAHWVATLHLPQDEGFLRGQLVDTDGARLPTWRLVVRSRDGTTDGRTDSGGFFHVRLAGAGPLDVFLHAPGAPPGAFAHTVQRGIRAGHGPVRLVVERQPAVGALDGRVQTSTLEPLPATLICWHHQRQEQARFRAEADGTFRLDAVPPGTIDLYVDHPGYARLTRPDIVVLPGSAGTLDTLVLDASAVLFGQVTGPNGEVPDDLQVTLRTDGQPVVGEYSAGTYRFAQAPPGRHVLQVQGTAVAAANFVVELQAGVDRQQDMQLEAGVPRRVVVHAPLGAGTSVTLALRRPGAAHIWHGTSALQSDGSTGQARGEFLVYMAPGSYEALAWSSDPWEGHTTITFVPGDDSPVAFDLVAR
jgi:hypothetical protein